MLCDFFHLGHLQTLKCDCMMSDAVLIPSILLSFQIIQLSFHLSKIDYFSFLSWEHFESLIVLVIDSVNCLFQLSHVCKLFSTMEEPQTFLFFLLRVAYHIKICKFHYVTIFSMFPFYSAFFVTVLAFFSFLTSR